MQTSVVSFFLTSLTRTVEKNDLVKIFDSDTDPLLGFTKIQYQCKVVGRGYNMYERDTESENTSSMIQDFVFLCRKIGSI